MPDDNSDKATVFTIAGAATRCSQNPCADRRVTRCGSLPSNTIASANTANPNASVIQANPPLPENTKTSVRDAGGMPELIAAPSNDTANRPNAIKAMANGTLNRSQNNRMAKIDRAPGKTSELKSCCATMNTWANHWVSPNTAFPANRIDNMIAGPTMRRRRTKYSAKSQINRALTTD